MLLLCGSSSAHPFPTPPQPCQVDSEHSKNISNDGWASYQLDKATSDPSHPYSRFGTGNAVTLRDEPAAAGVDVRAALLAFHGAHYGAERMTLAVVGSAPLDALEASVRAHFSGVPAKGTVPLAVAGHPYAGAYSGLLIQHVPVRDSRSVAVTWPIASQRRAWRC